MHRIRMIGATLLVAASVTAVVASAAQAALPEFKYETGTQSKLKEVSGLAGTLSTAANEIKCTSNRNTAGNAGVFTGPKSAEKLQVEFKGCKETKNNLTCGTAGVITTEKVKGELYALTVNSKAGLKLEPETGTVFAKFKCGVLSVEVTGCTSGEIKPTNAGLVAELPVLLGTNTLAGCALKANFGLGAVAASLTQEDKAVAEAGQKAEIKA